jgi:hypothetical protein
MTINFYVNKDDLDQLNKLVTNPILTDNVDPTNYAIEVYRSEMELISASGTDNFINRYFFVGISYEDFMRIEEFLRFL